MKSLRNEKLSVKAHLWLVVLLVLAACKSGDDSYDIILDVEALYDEEIGGPDLRGSASFAGTVSVPEELEANIELQLGLSPDSSSGGASFGTCQVATLLTQGAMRQSSKEIRYLVRNIDEGAYRFYVFANVVGEGGFSISADQGDALGYFEGSAEAPIFDRSGGASLALGADAELEDIAFAAGLLDEDLRCSASLVGDQDDTRTDAGDGDDASDVQCQELRECCAQNRRLNDSTREICSVIASEGDEAACQDEILAQCPGGLD